ncbi:hypothetical protein [uncultured Stenotrophomonas sp.]|nr:hypothetical protein [uncultured Stenotrophomonas sp.]
MAKPLNVLMPIFISFGGREDLHLEVDRQFGQHFPRDVIDLHPWPEQRQA